MEAIGGSTDCRLPEKTRQVLDEFMGVSDVIQAVKYSEVPEALIFPVGYIVLHIVVDN